MGTCAEPGPCPNLDSVSIATDTERRVPPSTLRNRLRDAREWRGLEQSDIARELGIGRSTVSNYERGVTEPGKLVVNAWAVVCDVDVEWLKTGQEQEDAPGPDTGGPIETSSKITIGYLARGHLKGLSFNPYPNVAAA